MRRWIMECVYRALNMGRAGYGRTSSGYQGMSSYSVPYSAYQEYAKQQRVPPSGGTPDGVYSYKPAHSHDHQTRTYEQEEYDVFDTPRSQPPLRVPRRPAKDHGIAMMQERLAELHEHLESLGLSLESDLDDVPRDSRDAVKEILRERRRIGRDLGDLGVDILEVEKDIEESRMPHDLDASGVSVGEEEVLEELDMSVWDREAGPQYAVDSVAQYGSDGGADGPDSSPYDVLEGGQTEAKAVGEDARQSEEHQEGITLDSAWQAGMHGNGVEMYEPFGQEADYSEQQQEQELEQEEVQPEELELEERLQPGPFDMPTGLESLL